MALGKSKGKSDSRADAEIKEIAAESVTPYRKLSPPDKQGKKPVTCLAFSPDGKDLVAGSADKCVRIWGLSEEGRNDALEHCRWRANEVAFSPTGKTIAVVCKALRRRGTDQPSKLYVHNLVNGHQLKFQDDRFSSPRFSPQGDTLAVRASGGLRLFDVASGEQTGSVPKQECDATGPVAFTPDGMHILTCKDQNLCIWPVDGRKDCEMMPIKAGWDITCLAFFADGERLVASSSPRDPQGGSRKLLNESIIYFWDFPARKSLREWHRDLYVTSYLACLPSNHHVVSFHHRPDKASCVSLWAVDRMGQLAVWWPKGNPATFAVSSDGQTMATGHAQAAISLWSFKSVFGEERGR